MKYLYIVCFILLPPILVLVLVGYCLYYYFKKENTMTHFQKSKLHTGLFADLTAETIGFTVHLPDVPDSDGTASEAGDTDQECFVPPDIGDEQSSDWSTEDAWEALRQ